MIMRKVAGLLAAAAVLLAGCSGDDGDDNDNGATNHVETTTGETTSETGDRPADPLDRLADLDGDTLCDMVEHATIEEQFDESIAEQLGGVNPPEQRSSVVCSYVTESFLEADVDDLDEELSVIVKVTAARDKATTAAEALDAYLVAADGETVAYEPVDGLGEAAGYAGPDLDVGVGGSHLATIIEVDGALIEVVARAEPDATLDQLRPLADELVRGVEAELG